MPDEQTLALIGKEIESSNDRGYRRIEIIVGRAPGLAELLIEQLCEVGQ